MFPQLLYVYTKDLRTCFYQQEFCFTNDFDITFNENKLIISKKKNPYIGLWGDKISNINLIIGKNGSGKTTLLDLLGSTKTRRMNLLRKSKKNDLEEQNFDEWFAVYHITKDTFVIEGYNPKLLENLVNIPMGVSDEYSICIKYDFNIKVATYLEYIQSMGYSGEKKKYNLENQLVSLYLTNNREKEWFFGNPIIEEQDYYVGFRRMYINKPRISNIYHFMTEGLKKTEGNFTAKNALCVLKRQEFDYFKQDEIFKSLKLNLYQNKNKILLFQNDISFDFLENKKKRAFDRWTIKEKFIIKLLESIIIDIWVNSKIKTLLNEDQLKRINNIDSILSENDSLDTRINYLHQVLKITDDILSGLPYMDGSIFSFDFIQNFTSALKKINDDYFITDRTLSIRLNDIYNEQINDLLSLYDDFVLNNHENTYTINIKFQNMSSGEIELVNGFSNLYTAIRVATHNPEINSILLLLDEPDAAFHPEWSRRYIYNIFKFLNQVDYGKEIKYQIIITTHSPFIVSDVPKEHITCINILENSLGEFKRESKKSDFGFMSNFYDIIQKDFFITSPIGEFAKDVFKETVKRIDGWTRFEEQEIEQVKGIISSIGENIIQMKLLQLLNEKRIKLLSKQDKIKRINEMEKELQILKDSMDVDSDD
ncbi:hypothetical protein CCZ20_27200 [Priestia aryabhattai]|uniref:AAA family ATPase n=1 Tax=Priestia aryabhattai TaxID=412384 RepID=UPI000B50E324|nr:AAA family ATPase [Priestia aryabhattai]OVE34302.1 hypothetical protein CCZ20_27200 [Priestia aryabhattai]